MPNIDEFINPKSELEDNPELVKLGGIRGCGKCREDVVGAIWDPTNKIMTWKCSSNHENIFQVD